MLFTFLVLALLVEAVEEMSTVVTELPEHDALLADAVGTKRLLDGIGAVHAAE